jgi:ABC-type antimicrobial peptide transport system permease subunit
VPGLALANLWRVPGRTALAATALAIGVAGVTLLTSVVWAFHGAVTGSLLGDAVSIRVRGVDTVAVGAIVLLGLFAIGDVMYLNVRDRAAELATLNATGWSAGALGLLVTCEGAGIGVLGAVVGAGGGLAAVARFADGLGGTATVATALSVAGAGVLLATLAAVVPALLLRRLPMARLLTED